MDWWRCLAVNLQSPMLCASAVLPGMVARQQGRIVNVASRGGVQPWAYGSANYMFYVCVGLCEKGQYVVNL